MVTLLDQNNPVSTINYVLISAVRNEEHLIEKTIQSVIAQTILPKQWIIVNDNSTDRTEEIVNDHASRHDFIKLISVNESQRIRNFASKAQCIDLGYRYLRPSQFNFVGNLDADVSFEPDYYERILSEFQANQRLGLAAGVMYELIDGRFIKQNISLNSVAGPIQLFRRRCFEEIGGYAALPLGGIDAIAEIKARMQGWETRTFPEITVHHHRRVGSGRRSVLATRFSWGVRDYLLGYHPLFYSCMCAYRALDRPFLIGSMLRLSGYCWSAIMRKNRAVPRSLVQFLQTEQVRRLKALLPSLMPKFKSQPSNSKQIPIAKF